MKEIYFRKRFLSPKKVALKFLSAKKISKTEKWNNRKKTSKLTIFVKILLKKKQTILKLNYFSNTISFFKKIKLKILHKKNFKN